jgi:uncharacterized OB-fold protein
MNDTSHIAPLIVGDPDAPFWEGWEKGDFLLHRCTICGRCYWPASCCVKHGMASMKWVPSTGRGVVETYTIFHHSYAPEFTDVPYTISVVRLDEGPLFHTRIVDIDSQSVMTGLRVEVIRGQNRGRLPLFRPLNMNEQR